MLTKKARITGFLMTVLLSLSAPLVYADNGNNGDSTGGSPAFYGGHQRGGFFKDLTDGQQKQLKDIWQKQKEARKAAFEQIKTNRDALTNELLQTTPDVNKINDLKSKLEALGTQMFDNRINSDLEVKKVLTAEQFARYLEFQKHQFSRRFHKGRWGHNGEGWGHWRHCGHSKHHDGHQKDHDGND